MKNTRGTGDHHKGRMSKKGQVTIFIIIGIVILGIISLMVFIYSSAVKKTVSSKDVDTIAKESQRYIDELVREKSIEAFKLLASQGFKIYGSSSQCANARGVNTQQGGNSIYCPYTELLNPQSNALIPVLIDPSTEDYQEESRIHFITPNQNVYGRERDLPPIPLDERNAESITNQINFYIKTKLRNELQSSLNSLFSEKKGYNFNINKYPEISTAIADKITINAKYEIGITKGLQKSTISESTTQIEYNFPTIYNFVRRIILSDVLRLDYNIVDNSNPRFEVRKNSFAGYDIIEVKDKTNKFEGEDYVVKFARRNRAPDASTISIQGREREGDARTLGGDEGIIYDGGTLTLRCDPNADPDEETNLRYEISGKGTFVAYAPLNLECNTPIERVYQTKIDDDTRGFRIPTTFRCGSTINSLQEYVGNKLSIKITDSRGLKDVITYNNPVKCNPINNQRCGEGKWKIGEQENCGVYNINVNCRCVPRPCIQQPNICTPQTPPAPPICTPGPCIPQPDDCCVCDTMQYKNVVDERGECSPSSQTA